MGEDPTVPAKLLLDRPASQPALGVGDIAGRIVSLILRSDPGFAIGIFGQWGTGKTTLIQTIQAELSTEPAIPVSFNAWRFEREPELLIPLLDTIRQALLDWAGRNQETANVEPIRNAARRIARVTRALLSGVSAEVGLPGAAKIKYDVGAAIDFAGASKTGEDGPQSLYFAGFQELSEAVAEAISGGVDRIVVLIDDLDQCLPNTALAVLEAIKLFFGLPGFVFVVGLDDDVIQDALLPKMWPVFLSEAIDTVMAPSGQPDPKFELVVEHAGSHFKKLFQVVYEVPGVSPRQIDELLTAMVREAELDNEQGRDLQHRVRPYLDYLERAGRVNPRRIKQFINSYTLVMLLQPELDPDLVLGVNTIAARSDWGRAVVLMRETPALFVEAITRYRQGDGAALREVWPASEILPASFSTFALTDQAKPLTAIVDFGAYLPSSEPPASSMPKTTAAAEFAAIHLVVEDMRRTDVTALQLDDLRLDVRSRIEHLLAVVPPTAPWGMYRDFILEVQRSLGGPDDEPETAAPDLADYWGRSAAELEQRLDAMMRKLAASMFW